MRLQLTAILFLIPMLCFSQTRLDTGASSLSLSNARVNEVIFADGTTQTTAGVSGSTTVTNLPDTLVYRNISNAWSAAQTLPAGSTIIGAQFGLEHWGSSNNAASGISYLFPTGAAFYATDYDPYIKVHTNGGIAVGAANESFASSARSVIIGGAGSLGSFRNGVLIGGQNLSHLAGDHQVLIGGRENSINTGSDNITVVGGYQNEALGGDYSVILGGRGNDLNDAYSVMVGGYFNTLAASWYNMNAGNYQCNLTAGSYSVIVGGYDADASASYTFTSGYEINNTHAGTYMFRTYDGDATEWDSAATNTFIVKTGGFGINTNDPQADLHVNGNIIFGNSLTGPSVISNSIASSILGGSDNEIRNSRRSTIAGGDGNLITPFSFTDNNFIGGGKGNEIVGGDGGGILSGSGNEIRSTALDNNVVVGGIDNDVRGGTANFVGGGGLTRMLNGSYNFMGGGQGNIIRNSDHSVVLGGYYNDLKDNAHKSVIIGGNNNILYGTNSILLQGSGVTVSNNNLAVIGNSLQVREKIYLGTLGDYLNSDGTNLFYYNSTGGVAQVTNL